MAMRLIDRGICLALSGTVALFTLSGCTAEAEAEPDFSGIKDVAELASLECYYHNVVKYHKDADGFLFGLGNIGEKNMWFEYDGIVRMGLDISKVSISQPDSNGVVTITIPEVEILGHPDIDTASMTDPIEANGLFTSLSASEKSDALAEAQKNLLEQASADDRSKAQAMERARSLLEQYAKNIGEALGQTYTVKWAQAENAAQPTEQVVE